MKPITKEMLQQATSDEAIAVNIEKERREWAMPLVTKVYDKVVSLMSTITLKTHHCCYYETKLEEFSVFEEEKFVIASEILKEYFPGCKVTIEINFVMPAYDRDYYGNLINGYRSSITIDWS